MHVLYMKRFAFVNYCILKSLKNNYFSDIFLMALTFHCFENALRAIRMQPAIILQSASQAQQTSQADRMTLTNYVVVIDIYGRSLSFRLTLAMMQYVFRPNCRIYHHDSLLTCTENLTFPTGLTTIDITSNNFVNFLATLRGLRRFGDVTIARCFKAQRQIQFESTHSSPQCR